MTTPNMDSALSKVFDVELTKTDLPIEEVKIEAKKDEINTVEAQREYVKGNLVRIIEKGNDLFDEMSRIARSTEAGKDFDVLSRMMKTMVETNTKLLEVEIAGRPQEPTTPAAGGDQTAKQITNNTVFVGTTAELGQFMRQQTTIDATNK